MAKFSDMDLLKMAQEIAVSATGASRGNVQAAFQSPKSVADLIQAAYDKLKEINDAIPD